MRPEWQAHIDQMLQQYRQLRDQLGSAQEQVAELTATAESEDGMVRVTVGYRGDLQEVELSPRVTRAMDMVTLGETIVATTRQATEEVRRMAQEIMAPLVPPSVATGDPTGGTDLMSMLPKDPTDLGRLGGPRR